MSEARLSKRLPNSKYHITEIQTLLNTLLNPILQEIVILNGMVTSILSIINKRENDESGKMTKNCEFGNNSIATDVTMMANSIQKLTKNYENMKEQIVENQKNINKFYEKLNNIEKLLMTSLKAQNNRAMKQVEEQILDKVSTLEQILLGGIDLKQANSNSLLTPETKQYQVSASVGLDSSLQLITLNNEEDYPNGSWLGDVSSPKYRVRCSISEKRSEPGSRYQSDQKSKTDAEKITNDEQPDCGFCHNEACKKALFECRNHRNSFIALNIREIFLFYSLPHFNQFNQAWPCRKSTIMNRPMISDSKRLKLFKCWSEQRKKLGAICKKLTQRDLFFINTRSTTPVKMALTLLDYLFTKDTLAVSNLSGKSKLGKKQLDPLMIYGIKCHLMHNFNISEKQWERIKRNIDSKCRWAWKKRKLSATHNQDLALSQTEKSEDEKEDPKMVEAVEQVMVGGLKTQIIHTLQGHIEVLQTTQDQILIQDFHNIHVLDGDQILPVLNTGCDDSDSPMPLTTSEMGAKDDSEENLTIITTNDRELSATADIISFVTEPMNEVLTGDDSLKMSSTDVDEG